jgi:hypothetical protein
MTSAPINGVLLRLFRRPLNRDGSKPESFDFFTFGYFDGMSFERKQDLQNLYLDWDKVGLNQPQDSYEEQRLYLYTKLSSTSREFQAQDLDILLPSRESAKYPLLIVSTELKLDDGFLRSNSLEQLESTINDLLSQAIRQGLDAGDLQGELFFKTFYSLSYSDFLVIFRASSFTDVMFIVSLLRDFQFDSHPLVKSSYSITGFDPDNLLTASSTDHRATVYASLKPGGSLEVVQSKIHDTLDGHSVVSDVFGKYDLSITINAAPLKKILELCWALQTEQTPFLDNLVHIHTRWLVNTPPNGVVKPEELTRQHQPNLVYGAPPPPSNDLTEQTEKKWFVLHNKIIEMQKNGSPAFPDSILVSVTNLLRQYCQICKNEEADSLMMSEFRQLLNTIMIELEQRVKDAGKDEDEDPYSAETGPILKLRSLQVAIEYFSEYIQDQIQASQLDFEVPTHNTKFIGSLTSIANIYSYIVEIFESKIFKELDDRSEWAFFTEMDRHNAITSQVLFANQCEGKYYYLVPILLDVTSFFDILNSIPLLFHEIGHYIPPRSREENNRVYLQTICDDLAQMLLYKVVFKNAPVLSPEVEFDAMIANIIPMISKNLFTTIWKKVDLCGTQDLLLEDLVKGVPLLDIRDVFSPCVFVSEDNSNPSEELRIINEIYQQISGSVDELPKLSRQLDQLIYTKPEIGASTELSKIKKELANAVRRGSRTRIWLENLLEEGATGPAFVRDWNRYIEPIRRHLLPLIVDSQKTVIEICKIRPDDNELPAQLLQILDRLANIPIICDEDILERCETLQSALSKIRSEKAELWKSVVDCLMVQIGDYVDRKLASETSAHLERETELNLEDLAACHLNEDSPANRAYITNRLVDFWAKPNTWELVTQDLTLFQLVFKEVRADYFMCRLLQLDRNRYLEVADKHLQKLGIKQYDSSYQLRKDVLFETKLFAHQAGGDSQDPLKIDKSTIDHKANPVIEETFKGLRLNHLVKYLDEIQENDCIFIENMKDLSIQELREGYHTLCMDGPEKFAREVAFIEKFTQKSYQLGR